MQTEDFSDVRNTVGVTLVVWVCAVAAGMRSDAFVRLPVEVLAALAAFATVFALAAVHWDERLRRWLDTHRVHVARLALIGAAILLPAAGVQFAGAWLAPIGATLWAPIMLFGVPVTTALALAAIGAAWRDTVVRPLASTAPAPRPAAT
ncbi:MAG: hypothetical protein IPP91_05620 [Betaproteobacteria bacterium]|nr:hypothetical protein [Betaproteobacteria bacterium]